jgi:DNA-binding beta-propeller fold protein YncE
MAFLSARNREKENEVKRHFSRVHPGLSRLAVAASLLFWILPAGTLQAQTSFVEFESGPVRPVALSPDGSRLFVTNIPDNRLEIFAVAPGGLTHLADVPVGMEPVAVAARSNDEVWVVNHLSDSVSIVDVSATPPSVVRTLLVGDEPRDIVFAGSAGDRAFITTAHRGQHRTHASISAVPGAGDPQLTTEGIGRADVWVFDADTLGATLGGTPVEILSFFSDTPRALATTPSGDTVYVAAFHSGNQTTTLAEQAVCNGFAGAGPCSPSGLNAPGGLPGPSDNFAGAGAPEVGLIVKFNNATGLWEDTLSRDWSDLVGFDLPDHDVFSIDADTLSSASVVAFDHVGTILFNMVVNPVNGKVYVTNTESPNHIRFEGPGDHGGSTVQGHLSESRVTVIDPAGPSVDPQHLNQHIDYGLLHTDAPDLVDPTQIQHSLATPLQPVVSSDGSTLYVAAFGSSKIGVFDTADIEDPSFEINFDPTSASADYFDTSGGPSGLALDETNGRLYVLTRFDNSLVSIDTTSGSELQRVALHNPEPASIVDGRPFLYDAVATSGNGEASCASCHIFGDFDSLAWDLGNPDDAVASNPQPATFGGGVPFHPMKGPMTTQTLRGLSTHGGMHWRGDRTNGFFGEDLCNDPTGSACDEDLSFRNFIVAFEGLVGKDGTITPAEMQRFSDFALQLALPPNPVRALDNSLTPQQTSALALYTGPVTDIIFNCNTCHVLDPLQGFYGSGGAQSNETETQEFKIAGLRNIYQKVGMFGVRVSFSGGSPGAHLGDQVRGFGMLHDGSIDTVERFLNNAVFSLSASERAGLEQLILAFDTDFAPIVGQQITLDAASGSDVDARIDLLIARANAPFDSLVLGGTVTECDLIAKGSVGGVARGWLWNGSVFTDDLGGSISDTDLRDLAASEGPVTYTCAPPGSGTRMAVDRDEDALLDGVETNTGVFVGPNDTGTNAALADTDGDGVDDGIEVLRGSDPNDPLSVPNPNQLPGASPLALLVLVGTLLFGGRAASRKR